MAPGRPLAADYERVTFSDLESIVLNNYDANERKSRNRVVIAFRHLRPFFERTPVVFIAGDRLEKYVNLRRQEGAKPATILYELATLRRAFRLAVKAGRLPGVPSFPTITVRNARKGFLEEDDFARVMGHLTDDVRPLAVPLADRLEEERGPRPSVAKRGLRERHHPHRGDEERGAQDATIPCAAGARHAHA